MHIICAIKNVMLGFFRDIIHPCLDPLIKALFEGLNDILVLDSIGMVITPLICNHGNKPTQRMAYICVYNQYMWEKKHTNNNPKEIE